MIKRQLIHTVEIVEISSTIDQDKVNFLPKDIIRQFLTFLFWDLIQASLQTSNLKILSIVKAADTKKFRFDIAIVIAAIACSQITTKNREQALLKHKNLARS